MIDVCLNCGGEGFTIHVVQHILPVCCGCPLPTGECCGNAVPSQEVEEVLEPCPQCLGAGYMDDEDEEDVDFRDLHPYL